MDHTHIVHANDLSRYADTRDSQEVIPELIYHLVRQSIPDATTCRIPYGEAINQPGMDGLVESKIRYFQFVPEGRSYWEIGTSNSPQTKATTDFRKRNEVIPERDRANLSFVFVTPRSSGSQGWGEPEQTQWIARRSDLAWKEIRIIDGVKLADWLREFPSIGRWMAKKMGLTQSLRGMVTPAEHWDLISAGEVNDPKLPPQLFTKSRDAACSAIEALFNNESQRLLLFSESEDDVDDFVSAFLSTLDSEKSEEYSNRCLFISDEDAWISVSELRQRHVLVASSRLGLDSERQNLQAIATQRGHSVIIPICGAWSHDQPQIIKLGSPTESEIETVLKDANFPDIRSRELAGIGGDRLSALRRHFLGLGTLPPYATWNVARQLGQAGLIGQWNANNPSDVAALGEMLGKDYGEWIEGLRSETLRSDSPLIQSNEQWRIVTRSEAWSSLGHHITDEDLDRFHTAAVSVLSEHDPKLELPEDQRYTASITGNVLKHSELIRKGFAETLALIGSRQQALSSCSTGKAETTAITSIRSLLDGVPWQRWASLNSMLPLLAEAAPNEFLNAVESALINPTDTPFHELFAQEGTNSIGGQTYISGLLWALEGLAWHPDYLSRVAIVLADLASIDPGGNWGNRPSNSLTDIFLPWHIQTTASFDQRKAAINSIIREQPDVGWSLLISLMPHSHGTTSGCHRPVWREFIPSEWQDGTTLQGEYWKQITMLTELAADIAKQDTKKLIKLLNRLDDLPKPAHDSLLDHLASESVLSMSKNELLPIWEHLETLARKHRRHQDAAWSLPIEAVRRIEEVAKALAPGELQYKHRHLFINKSVDLYDEADNFEEQRIRLSDARQEAIRQILGNENIDAVMAFAESVASPYEVGLALGNIAVEGLDNLILPKFINNETDTVKRVVSGFVWAKYWKLNVDWADGILQQKWSREEKAIYLMHLPFDEEVWRRVGIHLEGNSELLYWENVDVNPYWTDGDLSPAIEKLIEYNRSSAAVACVAREVERNSKVAPELASQALLTVLENSAEITKLDAHQTVDVIKYLQDCGTVDQEVLFQIEWNFLSLLDQFSEGSPITLEKRLASDPSFFADAIKIVFRSSIESENEADPLTQENQNLSRNTYKLLGEWKRCPGVQDDGSFDADEFNEWTNEARRITEESGHAGVAQIQMGHVLTHAPSGTEGLWIHEAVASVLNFRDTGKMRSGFTNELFNSRGVYWSSKGEAERELAKVNREKADELDSRGFTRFATAMREFADGYIREAEHAIEREQH